MKALLGKIVRSYGIQFAILLLLQISTDLPCSILVMCHNFNGFICSLVFYEVDNRLYVRDGAKVTYSLLVINILVIFGCLLSSFIVTIKSQIKYKWIVLLCMVIYSMFLPIVGFLGLFRYRKVDCLVLGRRRRVRGDHRRGGTVLPAAPDRAGPAGRGHAGYKYAKV